ncbi:MAG: MerR family transcriptional regulator [Deltaproteobacteria bacterium]|nr:MerR family transcriptional regulator [Nannocystaceae bacterium]
MSPPDTTSRLRSGTAARLAGLSAATLRVWEHRYGVVAPPKSAAGQRTYSMDDVQRLRLIRQLTLAGHAIGTVANLTMDALVLLSAGDRASSSLSPEQRVVVVGPTLAQKLSGRLRASAFLAFGDLAEAEQDVARCGATDVLVVQVASLHAPVTDRVLALRNDLPARAVVVVYAFGPEAAAQALRAAGVTVYREPVSGNELAKSILGLKPLPAPLQSRDVRSSPRRYSDSELVAIAELPSKVACECPRHLAEIVTLLVGFERYSAECASGDEKDAEMHRQLHEVTSEARTMFEQALARVVVEEGLVVRIGP